MGGGRKLTITQKPTEILGDVERPGDFYASGRAKFLVPRLEVESVGPIAKPLLPVQAEPLIKAATRAPNGRGADTSPRSALATALLSALSAIRSRRWKRPKAFSLTTSTAPSH
jgi:hypothetical protein